jgi:hypothetical protein
MPGRLNCLLRSTVFCAIALLTCSPTSGQNSLPEFQKILRERGAFEATDFAALEQGHTVVRLLPVNDKREVAVSGLVGLQVPADIFLQSFVESIAQKNNSAILQIGRLSATPTLEDLHNLTFEDRDLEDLKECVVGACKVKLSALMIERLQKEVDWAAPDYRAQATQLLKLMLLDYVREYLKRGDAALIEYSDKAEPVSLAQEHRALMTASGYLGNVLPELQRHLDGSANSRITVVENALVWSKIKFGLKPVIAINHILVFKREQTGPQIIVAEKQIYANHYFDSSLGLTAFVHVPGASPASYLFYENRSRADGLGGIFGKMKRDMIEGKAVDSLKAILETSRTNLTARALGHNESRLPAHKDRGWRGWRIFGIHFFAWLILFTAFVAAFTLANYGWKRRMIGGAPT